jgi:hypothetical protein
MNNRTAQSIVVTTMLLSLPAASWAALGGSLQTVQADQARMVATRQAVAHAGYEVHLLSSSSGTTVREFVNPAGTVFGVAWQGPFKPDLSQLLGDGFTRFAAAARAPHGGHRMLSVHAADLVIDSGGRMRSFSGRAYLPALVPAGVSAGDIQ